MAVAESDPPSRATLMTKGDGEESSLRITSAFDLLGDGPTWIHWTADAEIEGTTAGLDQGVLKNFADRKVEEIFDGLTKAVASPSP